MSRSLRTLSLISSLALIITLAVGRLHAADESESEFGFLIGAGFGDKDLVGNGETDNPNPILGLRYGHLFDDHAGFFADTTFGSYKGVRVFGDTDIVTLRFSVELLTSPEHTWRWFASGGLGALRGAPDVGSSFTRGLVSAGLGLRRAIGDSGSFRTEVRAQSTFTDAGPLGSADLTGYEWLLGWAWGVGGPPPDTDGDGVIDRRDECPDTPRGAEVDVRGCPKDSDGDGVFDGLDRCPDTPSGTPVDASGCPTDSDGDGVHDGIDACPNTPKGATVDAKGCPIDFDGDGVYDGLDRCPDTKKGAKVDAKGCPLDSDGDGVYDGLDRCPDTPKGTKVDAQGCPPPAPPPPPKAAPLFEEGKKSLVLEGVNFETDSAVLLPEARAILDRVAASLRDWPEVRVEIGGHTDSRGSDAHNLKLSNARAESVRQYLVNKGIDASRLTARGYGEKKPIADNKTDEGRAKNRRVELTRLD